MKPCLAMLLCITAASILAGCTKPPPEGQVLAQVDGTDITRRDLEIETRATNGESASSASLLSLVVDRTLLAEAAREQGIDKTPEFLATARRNREQLLADFYVQRIAKTIAAPKPQEIAGYIARHPQVFARREMIAFRRVDVVKTPTAESALRSARDFDAAIRQLASVGAKAVVSSGTLDTGEVSADVAGALEQVKDGRLAIVPLGYALAAYAVGARRATPLVGDDANDAAIRSITLERLSNAVADRLRRARANATIRFQPGLVPPTSAGNPAK